MLLGHAYNMHAHTFFLLVFRNLQRYMHYNGRWEAHVASQKLETKQVDEIKEKIVELEDNGTELKDYTWLSQVCACMPHQLTQQLLLCTRMCFVHAVM